MRTGSVVALVIGCLLVLPGVGLLVAGGGLGLAAGVQGEDGYVEATLDGVRSDGVALTAEGLELVVEPDTPDWVLEALEVDTRLVVTGEAPVFVGIAPQGDVDSYLAEVDHSEVVRIDGDRLLTADRAGGLVIDPPTDQAFWTASASGAGTQVLEWTVQEGEWAVVVMNADGSPGVAAEVAAGVRAGFLSPLAATLFVVGLLLTAGAIGLIVLGARQRPAPPAPGGPVERTEPRAATVPAAAAVPAGHGTHPVTLSAWLDPELSRWQWLVKWFLAIPHYLCLAFLWLAFVLLTMVAGVAILFTGTYPRAIFDFNVGVMRWSWRVSYYASSGGLGTDRYPPFTLADDPGYPARLDVAYPARLSRGLVLVKWWLLAIPHYIIVALLLGGTVGWLTEDPGVRFDLTGGGGVLGILALVAGLALLFTGRYPQQLFDVVIGFNRWVYRVGAYAGLMTDVYPPFRLDQGGAEPTPGPALPPPPPPAPADGSITLPEHAAQR